MEHLQFQVTLTFLHLRGLNIQRLQKQTFLHLTLLLRSECPPHPSISLLISCPSDVYHEIQYSQLVCIFCSGHQQKLLQCYLTFLYVVYLFLFKYIMCIPTSARLVNVILLFSKTRLTFCYTLLIKHYTIKHTILPRDTQITNMCPTSRIKLTHNLRVHHISFYQQQSHEEIISYALIGGHNLAENYKISRKYVWHLDIRYCSR